MEFDKTKYRVWTWKHPLMLHWIINPGLAINELIFGQRMPRVMLVERDSKKPLPERSYVPCPHCHTIHTSLKWNYQNKTAFKNWFGLYCDNCERAIPCLLNITTMIILLVTFPIWIWFYQAWKQKWLRAQKVKFSKPLQLTLPESNWLAGGLGWGFFMFIFMDLIFNPLIDGVGYSARRLALGFFIWMIAGIGFGYFTKMLTTKKQKKQADTHPENAG